MGVVLGLMFGLGVLLIWSSATAPTPGRHASTGLGARLRLLATEAGLPGITPAAVAALSLAAAASAFVVMFVISGAVPIAAIFAALACTGPAAYLRSRVRSRRAAFRRLWPDVVDNLSSAVRAGMSLPEAVGQLGTRGPEQLREPFAAFASDFRATGRFSWSLDRLKDRLADPVADRIMETLRVTRDVGGSDLGSVLRTLSSFLREESRVRSELEARQSWTVNGARLAVAAPWVVLALLSSNPQAAEAYSSRTGVLVLAVGGIACVLAYRLMLRIGRLPQEERVLR